MKIILAVLIVLMCSCSSIQRENPITGKQKKGIAIGVSAVLMCAPPVAAINTTLFLIPYMALTLNDENSHKFKKKPHKKRI